MDLRELMSRRSNYAYEAYNRPEVKAVRVPAERWADGAPEVGVENDQVGRGSVQWFSLDDGFGLIEQEDGKRMILHFTGIPGEGYRTVEPGATVEYEVLQSPTGVPCAVNVHILESGTESGPGSLKLSVVSGLNL